MKPHISVSALGVAAALISGCGEDATCPAWANPAITVQVTSASTGAPLLEVKGEVITAGYRDSLEAIDEGLYHAAPNRGGSYAVHLEHVGYAPWDTAGVWAEGTGGACATVMTQHLEAQLSPSQ